MNNTQCTVGAVFEKLRPIVEVLTAAKAHTTGHSYVLDSTSPDSLVVRLTTPGTAGEASFRKQAETIYASWPGFGFEVTVGRDHDLLCKVATENGTVMELEQFVDHVIHPLFITP